MYSKPVTRCLIAMAMGISLAHAAETKPLTNADIIKMLNAKLPESVIISKIQSSEVNFDTSTDAMIELNSKGVGEKLMNAMFKPKADATKPEDAPPPAAAPEGNKPSTLSYGTASGLVKKGVTTQAEILDLFGGPDVMTQDKDGVEIWMYDKKTSTTTSGSISSADTKSQSSDSRQNTSEASLMAKRLGVPFFATGTAKLNAKSDTVGSAENNVQNNTQNSGEVKTSSKTITFIIKFNENKTVKDYAVRQASY